MAAIPASPVATPASALEPRTVPVPGPLAGLLPLGGLRRGSVVAVRGPTSLLFALLSTATSEPGAWAAVVGRPDLGLLAAAEAGVVLERLALVPRPGAELATVAAALLDGIELVAVAGVHRLTSADIRRLTGRARQRGAVLLALGDWPGADLCLDGERIEWTGLGAGSGRLRHMRLTVRASGRGAAARPRTTHLALVGSPPPEYGPWPDHASCSDPAPWSDPALRPGHAPRVDPVPRSGSTPEQVREDVVVPGPRVPSAGREVVERPQVLRSVG